MPPHKVDSPFVILGEVPGQSDVEHGAPFVGGQGAWLDSALKSARMDRGKMNIVQTIGCCTPDGTHPGDREWKFTNRAAATEAVNRCAEHHLMPFMQSKRWEKIFALGEQALQASTGLAGITLWRGSPLQAWWQKDLPPNVLPTLSPSSLMKQANMFSVVTRDLQKSTTLPAENYTLYPSLDEVRAYAATTFAFDFEWDPASGRITICGLTDRIGRCLVVPFEGAYVVELKRIFEAASDIIGHNIVGADTKYFSSLGWNVTATLWDTMLMQHLVQPDMKHGLNFVASVFTNKVFWKGRGDEREDDTGEFVAGTGAQWKTWNSPDAIPVEYGGYGGCLSGDEAFRLYNARDTDGSFQCWLVLKNAIVKYGLEHTYWNVSVPIAFVCRDMSDAGLKLDVTRLADIILDLDKSIEEKEALLPEQLRPYMVDIMRNEPAPEGTYTPKVKVCKGSKKEPHEPWSYTFTSVCEFPCAYCGKDISSGKMKLAKIIKVPDKKLVSPLNSSAKVLEYAESVGLKIKKKLPNSMGVEGKATADKNARKGWAKTHPEFIIMSEVIKKKKLKSTFATDALLQEERMYFNLMPTGTAEGRFSSAGQRRGIDYNAQNIPKEVRKIFTVDEPGQAFLNLDVCQGENMITAYLAQDFERMERLSDPKYSEHADLASRIFNLTVDKHNPAHEHFYKAGKITNHGRNYGLGVNKMQEYFMADGIDFSIADIKEFIATWKKMNSRTADWQQEVIATAQRQSFLENPFGRRRWFQGRDFATKALAFLPASTLADVVIRMMLAHYPQRFAKELAANRVGTQAALCSGWRLALQVHDSMGLVGPAEMWEEQARRTATIMCQPWEALQGFRLGVDIEVALPTPDRPMPAWGDCKKVVLK